MNIKEVDFVKLSQLISQQIDHVTCLECCEVYKTPKTAVCGHTLCQYCWRGRRRCPYCSQVFDWSLLKHNQSIDTLTEHVTQLKEDFEKLYNINLTEFWQEVNEMEVNDPTKNVNEWLANSSNHFSAPAQNSDQSSLGQQIVNPLELSSSKVQIHTNTKKAISTENVVIVPIAQDDWENIEVMPEAADKNKENVVGPMDIEPFHFDDDKYTVKHPRRSSRNREPKVANMNNITSEQSSLEKYSSKNSSGEIDKKTNKAKQNWNNVKRMRQEFSKLNKKNRNKLNVSIEMCKKTQNTAKQNINLPQAPSMVYDIDENTPDNFINDNKIEKKKTDKNDNDNNPVKEIPQANSLKKNNSKHNSDEKTKKYVTVETQESKRPESITNPTNEVIEHATKLDESNKIGVINMVKMPFYKKGALFQPNKVHDEIKAVNTVIHNIDTNIVANDDIEITIKKGNTITNIHIKYNNDVDFKVHRDREVQTSLGPPEIMNDKNTTSHNINTQNFVINVNDSNHNIAVNSHLETDLKVQATGKVAMSVKCTSDKTKKNTDSADTPTAQFEITESEEKELSKVMEDVESDDRKNSKSDGDEKISLKNNTQKQVGNQDDLEYLNDLDIFDSESVKEVDVQLLKNTEPAPSEIFISTVHMKNRTPKHNEKRDRDLNDEDSLPTSKKAKLDKAQNVDVTIDPDNRIPTDSEPMNYDSIIGKVFASIDADIEENRQSQHIEKNTYTLAENVKEDLNKDMDVCKESQKKDLSGIDCSVIINDYCNQKDSENVFSVYVDKDDQNVEAPADDKVQVAPEEVPVNIDEFLTPVTRHMRTAAADEAILVNDVDIMINDDDSDKSVVEETPQKTSFTKPKQKIIALNEEVNQSQKGSAERKILQEKKSAESNDPSIVSLTDTSEISSNKDITIVETVKKLSTLETPLNINKFVDQIKHKSTPVARKSLNFSAENMDDIDPEQTLCPTNEVAKTTQEREFLSKAFEKTPTTLAMKPAKRSLGLKNKRYCVAGTCLTAAELGKLKILCARNKWTYNDKYSPDLTHLVVGVDEENKSQRSVKYMCALASSIWIISYKWVEKCLESKKVANEEYYEALDSTGEPGPRRSRLATKKIFQGITFYCMEPFSLLTVDILKDMLEAAGGRVVKEAKEVKVTENTLAPALLLAEPENTQEDKYIYLAVERSIVPVNYEWALNSLGSYTLASIHDLLLCPASLLHKITLQWPHELMARDED